MQRKKLTVLVLAAVIIFAGLAGYTLTQTKNYNLARATLVDDKTSASLEIVKHYRAEVSQSLGATPPILQVENPNPEQAKALEILTKDTRLDGLTKDKSGNVYRLEVLQNYKLPVGQAGGPLAACAQQTCYRLDLFNFTLNTAVVAIANLATQQLLSLQASSMQPELSPRLATIATEIAKHHPQVKELIGAAASPIMASTKTALERTVCEKSHHLCVAPTFVLADEKRALWVIVDLTDLKVVGLAWTKWHDKPEPLTERQLATQAIEQSLCGKVIHEKRGDWAFDYTLTGSDGLEIRNVTYQNKAVVASAKNVDWHVSYSSNDGFGYSDAVGCPVFSTAAVVPSQLPEVLEQDGQVVLSVDFKGEKWPEPCNYYYRQQFQMNKDGSLRVAVANIGRGCGEDGTYRPVTRIELPPQAHNLQRDSQKLEKETWWKPAACEAGASCPTFSYSLNNAVYDVIPGNGQFNDGGRGDDPFFYLSAVDEQRLEGQEDLLTIGPCCNAGHQQGPDQFVNDEPFGNKPIALWYVAQLKNNGQAGQEYCWAKARVVEGAYDVAEYPCYSGPLFKPRSD